MACAGSGCGLDVNGDAAGVPDAGPGGTDASADVFVASDAATIDGASATDATFQCSPVGTPSCFAPPPGWSVIAYAASQATACPASFAARSVDVEEGPNGNAACQCDACSVMAQPSCLDGAIASSYDSDNLRFCQIPGATLPNNPGGGCIQAQLNVAPDVKLVAPPASGVSCAAAVSKHKEALVFASKGRVCGAADPVSAGCNVGLCAPPQLPPPYAICLAASGVQAACPMGPFSVRRVVGTDVSFDCGACACRATADCSNGAVAFYANPNCNGTTLVVPADNSCRSSNAPMGANYQSYRYSAQPMNVGCTAQPPAATNVQLIGATTVCCAQ